MNLDLKNYDQQTVLSFKKTIYGRINYISIVKRISVNLNTI